MRKGLCLSVLLVGILSFNPVWGTPSAPLLNLTTDHWPLVYAAYLQADYYGAGHPSNTLVNSATEGQLVLSATVMQYTPDVGESPVSITGSFLIELAVNPLTGEGLGGKLEVSGTDFYLNPLPGLPTDDIFYSTTLTAFGSGMEDKFEFCFVQEGTGMLAPDAEPIGVIVDARPIEDFNDPDSPVFNVYEWDNGYGLTANAHTFYMPEPTTMIVLGVAGAGIVLRRRRSQA